MLRRLIVLASGGLLLLGAACGGDSKESSTNASAESDATVTTAAAPGDASSSGLDGCESIGSDDVAGVFGGEFTAMQDSSQGSTTICNTQRGEPVTSVQYTLKPSSAGEYDATIEYSKKSGATAQTVDGIGDKATRLTTKRMGITVIQVISVKGNALFYVTVSGQESYESQADQVARLLADNL